jgi:hypothetical protein
MKHAKIFSSPAVPGFGRHLAAAYCGVSVRLLDQWRADCIGPRYFKIGCTPRYWPAALDHYISLHPALKKRADLYRSACPYVFDAHFDLVPAPEQVLLPYQLAARLGVCKRTLNYWRTWGTGPDFVLDGIHVSYTGTAVRAYLAYDEQQISS